MPSVIVGAISGGMQLVSGNFWSGVAAFRPQGTVQLRWDPTLSSGRCYVGFSGGITTGSGAVIGSGGIASGMLDGMILNPSDSYMIPRLAFGLSGNLDIFVTCDAAVSGVGRLWFEIF